MNYPRISKLIGIKHVRIHGEKLLYYFFFFMEEHLGGLITSQINKKFLEALFLWQLGAEPVSFY